MPLLYHAYVYLEFLILACTIYILAPTSSTKVSETSYEYVIKLEENELIGVEISEMALIDEDGDVAAFSNFLAKGKDETEVTFTIEDNY